MAYVGNPIDTQNTFQSLVGKRFNGDGSTTAFTLDVAPSSTLDIEVFVGNVRQDPNSAYTLSGTTLTFTGAPPSGTNNIYVVHQAKSVGTINPPDDSVGANQLVDNSVGITQLNVSDGSNGQVLQTNGSGTLSFATVDTSSATDSFTISGSTPTLTIGDAGAEDTKIVFDGNAQDFHIGLDDSTDDLVFGVGSALGTTSALNITSDRKIATNGETSPDVQTGGLTINTAAGGGIGFSIKSPDVSHGFTSLAEADNYMKIQKCDTSLGGMAIDGFKENGIQAIRMTGNCDGTPDTGKSTSANQIIEMKCSVRDGTTNGATSTSNGNLFGIHNGNTTRFIFDAEGDLHSDSSNTTFDAYEDAHLVRAFDLSHGRGVIDSKFDKFIAYNHEKLAQLQLVGREEDGTPNHFVNVTGMQRLHNGAIWQQYEKHNQLLEAVYDLAKEAVGEEKANTILEKHKVKRLQ